METPRSAFSLWRDPSTKSLSRDSPFCLSVREAFPSVSPPVTPLLFPASPLIIEPCKEESEPSIPSPGLGEVAAVEAFSRFEALSKELMKDPALLVFLEKEGLEKKGMGEMGLMFSSEFFRGAMEMYRLGEKAVSQQMKDRVERSKQARKMRVKSRKTSLKLAKMMKY